MSGPLSGIKVVELAGIGPGPFAAMILADLGADVVRVDRAGSVQQGLEGIPGDTLGRGKRSIGVDLKTPEGVELVLRLVESADVLIEGFRPGVTERLGVGPDVCRARNPRLIYGRMTGWGQDGPYAHTAGHDLNYIALAGVLERIGRAGEKPAVPLNLIGDFGGGGMLLALGVACALVERSTSGQGQVIDAAMVDGAALLMTFFYGFAQGPRGTNLLDGGAPHYDVYECADGGYVTIGSIEPQFYAELQDLLGLEGELWGDQNDLARWPERKEELTRLFKTKTRDEWCAVLEGSDVCFAPALSPAEAATHPHNVARGSFVDVGGLVQPGPAPRFDRTPPTISRPASFAGAHTDEVLAEAGFSEDEIAKLRDVGTIA